MKEYIYSTSIISESSADIEVDSFETKIKVSLADIRVIYETLDGQNDDCLVILYKDGFTTTIYDTFARVDKLHNEYLKHTSKELLIKAQ